MNSLRKKMLATGSLALLMGVGAANATITVPYIPDGALNGGPGTLTHSTELVILPGPVVDFVHTPLVDLQSLDWNFGNALAKGFGDGSVGTVFTTYYQAKLATFFDDNGDTQTLFSDGTDAGLKQLDSNFEWTVVAKFKEVVISNDGTTARFVPLADPSNYVKIFYDDTPDADDLSGDGFADGLEIFRAGDPVSGLGVFASNGITGLLDQVNDDDHAGQLTLGGTGGFTVQAEISYFDDRFLDFPAVDPGTFRITFFNSSNILPFLQVDPAEEFFDMDLNGGLGGLFGTNLGTINGKLDDGGLTDDVQFQVDANQSFDVTTPIPEPATMMLGVMGFAGLLLGRRKHA